MGAFNNDETAPFPGREPFPGRDRVDARGNDRYGVPATPEARMRVNGEVPRLVGNDWWRALDAYRAGKPEIAFRLLRDSLVDFVVKRPADDGNTP